MNLTRKKKIHGVRESIWKGLECMKLVPQMNKISVEIRKLNKLQNNVIRGKLEWKYLLLIWVNYKKNKGELLEGMSESLRKEKS